MIKMKKISLIIALTCYSFMSFGQDSLHLSLSEAVQMGIDSSKKLMLAQTKIQQAINKYEQAKDKQLPNAEVSLMGSEAFIPTHILQIKGLMKEPMELPGNSTMYLGTLSINQLIFAGHKLQYAKASAKLLKKTAKLKKEHNREGVILAVIQAYINIYKIDQNIKVIHRNIHDVNKRLEETKKFKDAGLATLNDVLRFKLQKSQARLALVDLINNRQVANYALITMLGLPEKTTLKTDNLEKVALQKNTPKAYPLSYFINQALHNREDLKTYAVKKKINHNNIKSIKASKLPTLGAGINTYYLNPNTRFFPPKHSFLVPITVGLKVSWDISSLYTTKHKVEEAQIKKQQISIAKESSSDKIKTAVNKSYHEYLKAVQRIEELHTTVAQAKENDRIMELKYKNQLATTTDRIDAQTMLYKSLVDIALAKADAKQAWYELQATSGTLNKKF